MENGIKKILRDKYGLFEKDIEILLEKFTKFSVPKREIILQEGQTDHYILKSASNLNGNLNCSKELEHYAS